MYKTLIEILEERSILTNKGITFIEGNDKEEFLSYKQLYELSLQVLSFLQTQGIQPKDELVFQLEDNKTFIVIFWACILGGIVPVPLTLGRNKDHRQKMFNVWAILNNPYLIISSENLEKLHEHAHLAGKNKLFDLIQDKVLNVENIYGSDKAGVISRPEENDIAYVQFSSGSTGNPKGVILTHKNIIVNIEAICKASLYTENDSKLSWMPLTHDMGLIGFHLCPLFGCMNHYLLPTNLFIRRPTLWLDKATEYKATILCSPNFGYKYLLKQYNPANEYNWDLSNVRMVYNGAEPISEEICCDFLSALELYGLKKTVMYPVYGLAEASLAVSFSNLEKEVISINIDRTKTHIGETISLKKKSENTVSFVNVGKSIPYCIIRIVDDNFNECKDDVIGHIQIKGDNVTSGYYNNTKSTLKAISKDGWLDTGDLGFINEGCLYVTGRAKDIIFINGQNYYPHDIERSLEIVDGIELGKVAIGGSTSQKSGEEEIMVFVLHKGKIENFIEIHNNVKKHINQTFGFEPAHIIPVREIPKTTSGKVQRFKLIEACKNNSFIEVIQELAELLLTDHVQDEIIEPEKSIEKKLVEIWSEVLAHKNFGITQKFFDIGGNSLKGAQVLSVIHKEFGVELDYNILYEKQTIKEIAAEIEQHEITCYEAIPKIKELNSYPLSSTQRRLYYLWEVDKTSFAYNIPTAFVMKGKLDIEKLEKAIIKLIKRHEILRSSFYMLNGEPRQKFDNKVDFNLAVTQFDLKNVKDELKNRVKPYDLSKTPLYRIELIYVSDDNYILFLDFHHIISDGVSISVLLDELFKIYHGETLPRLEIQYKDYISWENEKLESEKLQKQSTYWSSQFEDDMPVLNLPTDLMRPSLIDYQGEKLEFQINNSLLLKLKEVARKENTSLFVLLLAAYNVLLSKYTDQNDIVVGIPVAGRNHLQLQSQLGMFVNNLALRSFPNGNAIFKEYLNQIKSNTSQAINNQDYPFERLVEQIGQKRDVSRNSLFDTMFIYQNMRLPAFQDSTLSIERFFFDPGLSKYDISLEIFDQEDKLHYCIEYSTSLFNIQTIKRFACYFENLLNNIVKTPNAKLSDLFIFNTEEYNNIVFDFNETKCDYPKDKVIHQLIEEQAKKTPNAIAVEMGCTRSELQAAKKENGTRITENLTKDKEHGSRSIGNGEDDSVLPSPFSLLHSLTYKQLNEKSNQLANFLRKKGVVPNIPVAIVLDRSPELIIAILGTLKAGGCYLPMDKDLPEERIKYILSDSQTNLVISDEIWPNASNIQHLTSNIQFINIVNHELYTSEPKTISNINSPHNLAYIIYTSGTTGNPKGVMVEHQSLVNYASFANKTYIKGEKVSFPLYTSTSFDLTITSVFVPLISGNTIVTYADNEKTLPLEDVIVDNQINVLKATPSHLKTLKEYQKLKGFDCLSKIKRIVVGGEALTSELAEDIANIFDGVVEIYNEYGPTEATVGCMIYRYDIEKDKRQSIPIGVPVDNTQIYLLDKHFKPVPIGVVGEIYISGDCLSRGYLFNPQLTKEKFSENPFITGERLYKTGDLAKRIVNGNIEFIGRVDQQVKINGYRVEIEEIEQQILKHQDVKEVVVHLYKEGILCAYVVQKETVDGKQEAGNPDPEGIKTYLRQKLPDYMVPKHIIVIDGIPLTKNGKVNYSSLPAPLQNKKVKEEATNDIQKALVLVWQDVLNESIIGVTDNFFELGGDSIKAVQIASRLFDQSISVNVKDILTYQTIEQLCLQAEITDGTTHYEQGIVDGEVDLNPIQRWFFEQNFENPHFYNQSVLLKFKKPINKEILQKAFKILIEHHDGLRMNFNPEKQIMFYNSSHLDTGFNVEEYNYEPQAASLKSKVMTTNDHLMTINDDNIPTSSIQYQTSSIQNICQQIKSSFKIENTLLIKAAILKEGNTDLLFITAHHLIIDGVSWRILMEEFYNIYNSLEKGQEIKLPKKTASLIDWNNKLIEFANSEELKKQTEYWISNVPTPDSCLTCHTEVKTGLPTPRIKDIQKESFQLTKEETQFLLGEANKPYNTNIEILLVTVLVRTLKELKNCKKIVIELESFGRLFEDVDLARTMGWFTSMFPVKFDCQNDNLEEQIKTVKEKIRKVPVGGSGYGVLKYINKSLRENFELAEGRFNYLGQFENELDNYLFRYEQVDIGSEIDVENHLTAKIEVNAMIINNVLQIEILSSNEFKNSVVEGYYKNLKEILAHLKDEDDVHFTSSDFDAVELDEEDLKVLFG